MFMQEWLAFAEAAEQKRKKLIDAQIARAWVGGDVDILLGMGGAAGEAEAVALQLAATVKGGGGGGGGAEAAKESGEGAGRVREAKEREEKEREVMDVEDAEAQPEAPHTPIERERKHPEQKQAEQKRPQSPLMIEQQQIEGPPEEKRADTPGSASFRTERLRELNALLAQTLAEKEELEKVYAQTRVANDHLRREMQEKAAGYQFGLRQRDEQLKNAKTTADEAKGREAKMKEALGEEMSLSRKAIETNKKNEETIRKLEGMQDYLMKESAETQAAKDTLEEQHAALVKEVAAERDRMKAEVGELRNASVAERAVLQKSIDEHRENIQKMQKEGSALVQQVRTLNEEKAKQYKGAVQITAALDKEKKAHAATVNNALVKIGEQGQQLNQASAVINQQGQQLNQASSVITTRNQQLQAAKEVHHYLTAQAQKLAQYTSDVLKQNNELQKGYDESVKQVQMQGSSRSTLLGILDRHMKLQNKFLEDKRAGAQSGARHSSSVVPWTEQKMVPLSKKEEDKLIGWGKTEEAAILRLLPPEERKEILALPMTDRQIALKYVKAQHDAFAQQTHGVLIEDVTEEENAGGAHPQLMPPNPMLQLHGPSPSPPQLLMSYNQLLLPHSQAPLIMNVPRPVALLPAPRDESMSVALMEESK